MTALLDQLIDLRDDTADEEPIDPGEVFYFHVVHSGGSTLALRAHGNEPVEMLAKLSPGALVELRVVERRSGS